MYSNIVENLIEPIYDAIRGTSRYRCRRVLEKTQYLNGEEIQRMQAQNLRVLVTHAYKTVPYYHKMFKKRRVKPDDIKTVQDLKKLPVLKKADIRRNFSNLISRRYSSKQLISYETGGTGSPLKFLITKEKMSWEIAAEYRAYSWANYRLGDRCFMLWGSHKDLRVNILKKAANLLQRTVAVDPFLLSDAALNRFARMMSKFRPEVIRGYATPVYMMAKLLQKEGISNSETRAVITSAEMLLPHMRKTIEEAFNCPVFDYYGSRELGAISSECEEHRGYHVTAENAAVEFVQDGEVVCSGESGVILLTSLRNYGMPLIRYEIGDVGEPSDEVCNCGRGLPLMKAIKGRISQFLGVMDEKTGKIVPYDASLLMEYLMILLKSPPEDYRIVQESLDHIIVKIVKGRYYKKEDYASLVSQLHENLGNKISVEIQFVESLPPLPSGKRSPVISKINAFNGLSSES